MVPATTALYRLAPPAFLAAYTFHFKVKQHLDEAQLKSQLTLAGYQHVTQVVSPGEYAVRGGLIDLFPMGSLVPYRVDLFDDEIDSIRTFDPEMRKEIHLRVKRTVEDIATSGGATARVNVSTGGLITQNDASLLEKMTPTLQRTAGDGGFKIVNPVTGSEDFPAFTKDIPGLFYFLGVAPKGMDQKSQPANHSPLFFADEAALPTGVRAMTNLAVDYLKSGGIATAKPAMKQ